MTNDISETNLEDAVPCFALSKNDSYVMSASGGKISLFNMMTFKVLVFMQHAPNTFGSIIAWNTNFLFYWWCNKHAHTCTHSGTHMYMASDFLYPRADYDNVHATPTCCDISCIPSTGQ